MRDNWSEFEFSKIIKSSQLGTDLIGNENNSGIPLLKMGNLTVGGFSFKKLEKLKVSDPNEVKKFVLNKGDFLFNTRNTLELVGKSAVWNNALALATFNSNIMRIKFNESLADDFYLGYYFSVGEGWAQFKRITTGTTSVAAIYSRDLFKCQINLPPLPQQKKIAKILSTVDNVIEKTESAIAKYQAIKQGLMHDLFTRGIDVNTGKLRPTPQDAPDLYKESALGLIPRDWEVKKSLELMTFYNGRAYSITEWEDKGTPVIRLQNLTGSGNDFYYSNLKLPDHQYCHKGDLLYMWSATFGPHIWQGPKAIYHYHIWKVVCNEDLYCKDFAHIELSRFTEKVMQTSQGSTMAHITKGGMEERIMNVPQLKEQNIISESLNSLKTKIQTEQQVLAKYQQLKAGLLQDLLTGKVEVSV